MKISNAGFLKIILEGIQSMPAVENFTGEININVKVYQGGITKIKTGNETELSIPKKNKKTLAN